MSSPSHATRGGDAGRERQRILSHVMRPTTMALLDRIQLNNGMTCLDVGCGGGSATQELARRVSPRGRAVGADINDVKVKIARQEAQAANLSNLKFRTTDIHELTDCSEFDVVYSRFLLTHLSDPAGAVATFYRCLRPGGMVALEDIDFSGYFTYPENRAFNRYHELYCQVVRNRGGDPDIGPRLPSLLLNAGFKDVGASVVQPMATQGECKLINPITMENIAESVMKENLATREEIDGVVRELFEFAEDPSTLAGFPRVVQAWGRRPVE